jgi:hypothetical protein
VVKAKALATSAIGNRNLRLEAMTISSVPLSRKPTKPTRMLTPARPPQLSRASERAHR